MVHLLSDELRWHGRKVRKTPCEYTAFSSQAQKQEDNKAFLYTFEQFHLLLHHNEAQSNECKHISLSHHSFPPFHKFFCLFSALFLSLSFLTLLSMGGEGGMGINVRPHMLCQCLLE